MSDDDPGIPESLGEIVRRQRELAALSMRQFAAMAASPILPIADRTRVVVDPPVRNGLRSPQRLTTR